MILPLKYRYFNLDEISFSVENGEIRERINARNLTPMAQFTVDFCSIFKAKVLIAFYRSLSFIEIGLEKREYLRVKRNEMV